MNMPSKKKSLIIVYTGLLLIGTILTSIILMVGAAPDTLVILHPHSADFANYVINDFEEWYIEEYGTTITIQQITMSSGACYTQVKTWAGAPEADVMWGGGEYYFVSMASKGLLEGYQTASDAEILDEFGGWPLKDPEGGYTWYAAALSTFGIMWNEEYLEANDLVPPERWEDLTKPEYHGHIVMCDPAKSGSTTATVIMVIQHFIDEAGWEDNATAWQDAWRYWAEVAGNVGLFTESSHDVPQKVILGEYGLGITIDYYAWEQIQAGENVSINNGGATTVSTDPAGMLNGAPHPEEAKRWMNYITSERGQTAVGYGRMPTREDAPPVAPVLSAWHNASQVPVIATYNRIIHNEMYSTTREMFSHWLVKNHDAVKAAKGKIIECEERGLQTNSNYQSAVQSYDVIPEVSDTLNKALSLDTEEAASGWETWGSTHFEESKTSAQAAITESETEEDKTTGNQMYTYIGSALLIIVLAAAYMYTRQK
jgi:ABC-type Fe3+ transport system substrate-binding protein